MDTWKRLSIRFYRDGVVLGNCLTVVEELPLQPAGHQYRGADLEGDMPAAFRDGNRLVAVGADLLHLA